MRIYINGEEKDSAYPSIGSLVYSGSSATGIGADTGGGDNIFNSYIHQVRLYNSASLTTENITEKYKGGIPYYSNLVFWHHYGDLQADDLKNSYDGTINGTTSAGDDAPEQP